MPERPDVTDPYATPEELEELRELILVAHARMIKLEPGQPQFILARCQGKHRFESFNAAQATIRNKDKAKQMHVFHCNVCHGYHIGNTAGARRRKLGTKYLRGCR